VLMKYESGEKVLLGDMVRFDSGPDQYTSAKVVMIGEDYSRLEIETDFLEWVVSEKVLEGSDVIVERKSTPGSYMFTSLCCVELIKRSGA